MRIIAGAGATFNITEIKLYKFDDVNQIAQNKAKAMKALGPGAAAIGVGGAPSLTLAAEAAALSLVTGFLAGVAAKQAIEQLAKVQAATELLLREMGTYVPIEKIFNLALPYPSAWSADVSGLRHVHSGDDFVLINSEEGSAKIRWSSVAAVI